MRLVNFLQISNMSPKSVITLAAEAFFCKLVTLRWTGTYTTASTTLPLRTLTYNRAAKFSSHSKSYVHGKYICADEVGSSLPPFLQCPELEKKVGFYLAFSYVIFSYYHEARHSSPDIRR